MVTREFCDACNQELGKPKGLFKLEFECKQHVGCKWGSYDLCEVCAKRVFGFMERLGLKALKNYKMPSSGYY